MKRKLVRIKTKTLESNKRGVEMELIHPNNYCHLCRIPQTYYASFQDLEVLSSKKWSESNPRVLDSDTDENVTPIPVGHQH